MRACAAAWNVYDEIWPPHDSARNDASPSGCDGRRAARTQRRARSRRLRVRPRTRPRGVQRGRTAQGFVSRRVFNKRGEPLKLRPEEITSILKQRIEEFDVETDLAEVGTVLQVGDGIARVYGLENAIAMEMLELEHGVTGLAFNLEEDNVGTALFGEWEHVREGEPVKRTGEVASVPVGPELIGRIVNPLGQPVDGQGPIQT